MRGAAAFSLCSPHCFAHSSASDLCMLRSARERDRSKGPGREGYPAVSLVTSALSYAG